MKRLVLVLVGFAAGLIAIPAIIYFYLVFGNPPVATSDTPFPFESRIVKIPMAARIHRDMPATTPLPMNDANLIAGAAVYQHNCAFCHGLRSAPTAISKTMFPRVPQLWSKHKNGVVGVSDDPVGETYWKVKNGIRLSGMPSYDSLLSEDQMWQVSILLSQADKPLPADALKLVSP